MLILHPCLAYERQAACIQGALHVRVNASLHEKSTDITKVAMHVALHDEDRADYWDLE